MNVIIAVVSVHGTYSSEFSFNAALRPEKNTPRENRNEY